MLLPVAKIRAAIFFLILPAFLLIINRKWIVRPINVKKKITFIITGVLFIRILANCVYNAEIGRKKK